MRVWFDHSDAEAGNITSFWFRPEKRITYTAGQFIELTLKHNNPDDRGEKRWFTLSSSPGDDLVSITTKLSKPGSSFKLALQNLQPGTELRMVEPMGDFVLPKNLTQPLIFIAGGIGLTPFHSMFEWLAKNHEKRSIQFIYGVRNEDEIIFQDTFQRAGIRAIIVVNQPSEAWGGEQGELSSELILGLVQSTDDTLVYLSGPEPMIERLANDLHSSGIKKHQFVTDFFPGYIEI
ncbi:MAG: ferredoxin--NADP reductase [Candidatus Saccharimonadales bacterium]